MNRLAIVTTHPIQYNAPLFRILTERRNIEIKVFYTWGSQVLEKKFDPGFGKVINWDIPLLDGYEHEFIENISRNPGSHHFRGIDNPSLISAIESWQPDAVLVFGWSFKSHLKCLRYFHNKIPVFFRGDSILGPALPAIKSFARKFVLKWVYRHVEKAFYVGSQNKKYFLQYGLENSQLVFAPHAVDNGRFLDADESFGTKVWQWKRELGIGDEELVILYAGKLEPIKNLEWLIETVKKMKAVAIKVIIVGNGPLEQELKEQASADNRFIFLDFQNQQKMPVVYRLGDVFVLCSHSETWGLSINEAMASGLAIMAAESVGCSSDLVANGENGYTFNSLNDEAFYDRIVELATNKALVRRMGIKSKELIRDWNFEKVCIAIEQSIIEVKKRRVENIIS